MLVKWVRWQDYAHAAWLGYVYTLILGHKWGQESSWVAFYRL